MLPLPLGRGSLVLRQLAQSLSERLEASLTELGLDVNDMYHMSRGDQLQLISQVTDKVLSNQDLGEPVKLVERENVESSSQNKLENSMEKDKIEIGFQFFANKGLAKQSNGKLKKSIVSWQSNIDIHKDKIANPEKYDSAWNMKSEAHKAGLLKHWEKEVKNFEQNIKAANDLLAERGYNE